MPVSKKQYKKMTEHASPPSRSGKNYVNSFWIGGLICVVGQAFYLLYEEHLKIEKIEASSWTACSLIILAAILTALGLYPGLAKIGGAGTHVPITGFANAMTSAGMEFRSEGLIFGVGAKIFSIAGPVLVYGYLSALIYGIIYWIYLKYR